MINLSELRIGNIVEIMENFEPVKGVMGNAVYFGEQGFIINILDFVKPVRLTEENILKLDFCKDNSENNKTYLSPMFDGNVIKIYFNRFGVAKFQMNMHFSITLLYMHQLQNLFNVLSCGRELLFSTEP